MKRTGTPLLADSSRAMRGFTLTEVAIVLGIVGVILGAIWAATAMVYENNRTRQASAEILTIINNWKSVYGNKRIDLNDGDYIMSQMTVNNDFAPQEMIPPPGTNNGCIVGGTAAQCQLMGPWSNQVYVRSGSATNSVQIQFNGLTPTQCNNVGNAIGNATGLVSVTIDGGNAIAVPAGGPSPVTTSVVSAACVSPGAINSVWANFSMN